MRSCHIGRQLAKVVRRKKLEEIARDDPFGRSHELHVAQEFRTDLRQEHRRSRDRTRHELREENDVEENVGQARAPISLRLFQINQQADVVENEK